MPYPFPADVRRLVDQQLASGAYGSEDELLREALRSLSGEDDDLAALEEATAELDSDPGQPLAEAFADVRGWRTPQDSSVEQPVFRPEGAN